MRVAAIFLLGIFSAFSSNAQDPNYARRIVDSLTAPYMHGRGYVNNGDKIAAEFIAREFKNIGLKTFTGSYFQDFGFKVNSFPAAASVSFDRTPLKPGEDFIIDPSAPSVNKSYSTIIIDSLSLDSDKEYKRLLKRKFSKGVAVFTLFDPSQLKNPARYQTIAEKAKSCPAVVKIQKDKFTWSVSTQQSSQALIYAHPNTAISSGTNCELNIKADYKTHQTSNVIGFIEGSKYKDSFIVFTGHYDHLGRMGQDAYFPGANDNASGIAMLLDLATYYSQPGNKPDYSIAFIAFAGEEAGLIGSYFYTTQALFPLKQISFLLNLDLMGTGDNGMTAVNGSVFRAEFDTLVAINQRGNYLNSVNIRGKAANSDHHHFTENGVPSFFFYLMSNYYKFYHDVHDSSSALGLDEFSDCSKLIRDFTDYLQRRFPRQEVQYRTR